MAYPDEKTVQTWLAPLEGMKVCVKKMFGCYCLYCDDQPVGWISEKGLSLREVGLPYLPQDLRRPAPTDAIQEICIPLEYSGCAWFPRAVADTAKIRRAQSKPAARRKK